MSRSTLRSATVPSGKPRRRKWKLRTLTTMILTAGSLASLAGPAQAYDSSTCEAELFVPVTDVDPFYMWQGSVDFGDGWHLLGIPRGNAVVCWGGGAGDVSITGKLYADSPTSIIVGADVRFFFTDGSYSTSQRAYFSGRNGENQPVGFAMNGAADVDRVRIRLWNCGSSFITCNLSNAVTIHRGD